MCTWTLQQSCRQCMHLRYSWLMICITMATTVLTAKDICLTLSSQTNIAASQDCQYIIRMWAIMLLLHFHVDWRPTQEKRRHAVASCAKKWNKIKTLCYYLSLIMAKCVNCLLCKFELHMNIGSLNLQSARKKSTYIRGKIEKEKMDFFCGTDT